MDDRDRGVLSGARGAWRREGSQLARRRQLQTHDAVNRPEATERPTHRSSPRAQFIAATVHGVRICLKTIPTMTEYLPGSFLKRILKEVLATDLEPGLPQPSPHLQLTFHTPRPRLDTPPGPF